MNDSTMAAIAYGFREKFFFEKPFKCKIEKHKYKKSGHKDGDGSEIYVCLECYKKIVFETDY